MQDVLVTTTRTHFVALFRAGHVQNFLDATSQFLSLLVTIPLGIQVLNGTMLVGDFTAIYAILVRLKGLHSPYADTHSHFLHFNVSWQSGGTYWFDLRVWPCSKELLSIQR